MKKISLIILILFFSYSKLFAENELKFLEWKKNFKDLAIKNDISEMTFDLVMNNARYLSKVIEYDRYQPEFYEDTKTYVSKRTSNKKVNKGINFYNENLNLINQIEKEFDIEKELLLSLMGIETNFGSYVGKMDIISSLATLSYDKKRLITRLYLVLGLALSVIFNLCRQQ